MRGPWEPLSIAGKSKYPLTERLSDAGKSSQVTLGESLRYSLERARVTLGEIE
jgi:hypothetical protein